MYLGELTRLVLLDVIEQGILFNGQIMSKKLTEKGAFPTWFVSQVKIFRCTLFVEIKAPLALLKSTLLLKIECRDAHIYMKTECIHTK